MNRYEIALQVLQKLKPEMVPNFDQVGELPAADARIEAPQTGAPLRLEEYIDSVRPLPEMTLLLGKCEDGLPILVDLENPACGSILINSAPEAQGRYLLRTLLASARLLNRGNQVQYSLITSEKSYYGKLAAASQWRHDYHPANRAAGVHILEISALVEQRYSGRRRGPAILVAIDDLEAFARGSMDEEVC
ncbi:MAG TPA: hypothetical protein VE136_14360, partial [Anaerolineales bacterium]|nr:hypothetical protein [Anaerolineales bacterium]